MGIRLEYGEAGILHGCRISVFAWIAAALEGGQAVWRPSE